MAGAIRSVPPASSPWPWSSRLSPPGCPRRSDGFDDRRTHSITDDAFVEAHIVNIAPQLVSGRIVSFLAEEDDRVVQGRVLAEIDSIPYATRSTSPGDCPSPPVSGPS